LILNQCLSSISKFDIQREKIESLTKLNQFLDGSLSPFLSENQIHKLNQSFQIPNRSQIAILSHMLSQTQNRNQIEILSQMSLQIQNRMLKLDILKGTIETLTQLKESRNQNEVEFDSLKPIVVKWIRWSWSQLRCSRHLIPFLIGIQKYLRTDILIERMSPS
jgi:hypothetical protein